MTDRDTHLAAPPATPGVGPEAGGSAPAQDRHRHPAVEVLAKLARIPQAVFGVVVIALTLFAALFAPWIVPVDPQEMDFESLLSGMTAEHWLGTDRLGRDTLARLIDGAAVALMVSIGAVGLGVVAGAPLGLVSVYFRGFVDDVIMRAMDAVVVFPSLLIAVGLAAAMGGSLTTVIVAIGIANVPWMARIVRSQALTIRELDFVAAAEAGGMSHLRIILKHILPNSVAPVIVQATLSMGYAVLTEAALGFIGDRQPMLSIVPGVAIFFLVLAFNFVGDALRDVLDPRLKGVIH